MNKVTSEHENGPSIVSHQGNANENQPEPCPLSQKGTETGTMSRGDGGGNWRSPSGRVFVSISYSQALVSCESQLSLLVTFPAIDTHATKSPRVPMTASSVNSKVYTHVWKQFVSRPHAEAYTAMEGDQQTHHYAQCVDG